MLAALLSSEAALNIVLNPGTNQVIAGISASTAASIASTNVSMGNAAGATNLYGNITRSQVTGLEGSLSYLSNSAPPLTAAVTNQWQADAALAAQRATNTTFVRGVIASGATTNGGVITIPAATVTGPSASVSTNNASTLTNIQPYAINWSGISTAAFTNGVAARIPVYTNSGTVYYMTLSTNSP